MAFGGVSLGNAPIAKGGWRYNLTIMREQAKTDKSKAKQYSYYLKRNHVTDAYIVAYGAAVEKKYGGASSSGSKSSSSSTKSSSNSSANSAILGSVNIAQSGWRYNMVGLREQAKTNSSKAKQYGYYLKKMKVTDAYIAAYGAAVDAKFGGGAKANSSDSGSSTNSGGSSRSNGGLEEVSSSKSLGGRKPVFQGFRYNKMPNLSGCGLTSLKIFYHTEIFGSGSKSKPNISQLKNVVIPQILKKRYQYAVLDIEVWDPVREMDKLIAVAKTVRDGIRAKGGRTKIGYYLLIPERNWLAPVQNSSRRNSNWHANNSRLKRLANEVDVVFPSLYTVYDNQRDWLTYAKANLAEARKYGKPVIPFIWPQIHDWNKVDGQKYMAASFWKTQLETVYSKADGLVIWGSIKPVRGQRGWDTWHSGMPWWEVTKSFTKANASASFSGCRA